MKHIPDPAAAKGGARIAALLEKLATVEISPCCYACGARGEARPDGLVEVRDGERRYVEREVRR